MPVSAVYILDSKGKVIISRDYRGDVPIKALERFITHVLETEETELKPIFEEDGTNYIYIKYNSLYGTFRTCIVARSCPTDLYSAFLTTLASTDPKNAISWCYIVLAVSKLNADATTVLLFLYKLVEVRRLEVSLIGPPLFASCRITPEMVVGPYCVMLVGIFTRHLRSNNAVI